MNRIIRLGLIVSLLFLNTTAVEAQSQTAIAEVKSLIGRIAPGKENNFELELVKSAKPVDSFYLSSNNGKIRIKGASALALSKGFNEYLNKFCLTRVSWFAKDPVVLPETLPQVTKPIGETCRFDNRFFLNYCTFGYTMLWWQWQDWERLIDWMALNGINMPLAITGQEYVWQKVYKQFGMSEEESRKFFTGPGHLPWQRMGNLDRWLGPLPQEFINHQFELQKQILKRERAFGMKPVLPAFAGHVPPELKKKFPNIKVNNLGSYGTGKQNDAFFLDPMDPLFVKLQKAYLTEQNRLLGTDHLYGADPFNEMTPPSWEPSYMANVAKTIYSGMQAVDKDATWVQMGWTFYYDRKHWTNPRLEAMIKAVPKNKMIILEYIGEHTELWRSTDAFFNAPYIWCYLGNFGGNTQLAAPILKTANVLQAAENDGNKRQMSGVGTTLEGFGVNDFVFEWLYDYAWDKGASNVNQWITNYAYSRAGHKDDVLAAAWLKMLPIVYNNQVSYVGLGSGVQLAPVLKGTGHYTKPIAYDFKALANLLPLWLMPDEKTKQNHSYQRDLVLVEKQVLGNLSWMFRDSVAKAYYAKNKTDFNKYTKLFLEVCDDMERLVGTQQELLLGDWVGMARDFGKTNAQKDYYEKNSRVLITTWGGEDSYLTEYAGKEWSGLIETYYKPRWQMFFDDLSKTIDKGTEPDMKIFNKKRAKFDWDWTDKNAAKQTFKRVPNGNSLEVCQELYKKWALYL